MKVFEIIDRLEKMIYYLKKEDTGSAKEFANKVGISRSMLFNYFEHLKAYEIDIKFDKKKNSFVITNNLEVKIRNPIKVIEC